MKKLHKLVTHRWIGIVFLTALVTIFSAPYIFLNKTPFPSSYQGNHFPPWSNIQEFWGPVKNSAMPDIIDQIYPWRHFSVSELSHGKIAYWNPNSFAGSPHLANLQSAVFSPFNFLFLVVPFVDAWTIMIIAQPLIAGISMYIFLRSYKKSKIASLIGSTAFMFSGFLVVWMAYGTLAMAISVLPLILFGTKELLETGKSRYGLVVTLGLMFSFFSGHFQTSLYLFLYLVAYCLFMSLKLKNIKRGLFLIAFIFLGLFISLLQILPTTQFYLRSVRSDSFITGGGIPFDHLVTLIAPDFFGNPVTRNDWVGYYAEWAMFIGIIPFFLALVTLFKREPVVKFFWFMVIVMLILAVSSPVQAMLGMLKLPVISTSNPSRIVVLLSFFLSFLSAFGLDNLLELIKSRSVKRLLYPIIVVGLLLTAVWIFLLTKPFPDTDSTLAMKNFILPTLLYTVLVVTLFFAVTLHKKKIILTGSVLLILSLASFDSVRFATKWMPVDDKDKVFVALPVIEAMQKEVGHGRMFGNLGAQVTTYYNIPGIEGYDPLYIGRYGEFIRASQKSEFIPAERLVVKIDRNGKYVDRVIDLLGVNVIFHPRADTNQTWAYPVWDESDRFEEIYKDNNFQLFKNNTVIPRGSLYFKYEIVEDGNEILKRFYEEDFDFRNTLILEKDPGLSIDKESSGSVVFTSDSPSSIVFMVDSSKPGLLFLSDNYYPGWRARVNGNDAEVYRANYTFRAVKVPEGKSTVEFYYQFEL